MPAPASAASQTRRCCSSRTVSKLAVRMLVVTDPFSLPQEDAIAGSISFEKALRMLAAVGATLPHRGRAGADQRRRRLTSPMSIAVATGLASGARRRTGSHVDPEVVRALPLTLGRLRRGELTWRQVKPGPCGCLGPRRRHPTAVEPTAVPGDPAGWRVAADRARTGSPTTS